MIDQQSDSVQPEPRTFLPLGSIVILKGSVKKLLIVSRGSIVAGDFFDYGAFLYPEGMIDTNIAYFNQSEIMKVVHEGYCDEDDTLVLEILNDAHARFQAGEDAESSMVQVGSVALATSASEPVLVSAEAVSVEVEDPFAGVRDLGDDDE